MVALPKVVLLGLDLRVLYFLELHLSFFLERVIVLKKHIIQLFLLRFDLFVRTMV